MKKLKILLIGNSEPVKTWKHMFRQRGHLVIHVGVDGEHLDLLNVPGTLEGKIGPLGPVAMTTRRFNLESLLDILKFRFDLIFHCQSFLTIEGASKSPIPYVYYHTEGFFTNIPRPAHWVVTPSVIVKDYIDNLPYHKGILPFILRADLCQEIMLNNKKFFPKKDREIKVFFSGNVGSGFPFYKDRAEIISSIKDFPGSKIFVQDRGMVVKGNKMSSKDKLDPRLKLDEYLDYLSNTQYGINVPTPLGVNFRDLEVCAAGAILVTRKTRDHVVKGFEDGVNCYFYEDKEEIPAILEREFDPTIAARGQQLVMQTYSPWRVIPLLDNLLKLWVPSHADIPDLFTLSDDRFREDKLQGEIEG